MAITAIDINTYRQRAEYKRSPRLCLYTQEDISRLPPPLRDAADDITVGDIPRFPGAAPCLVWRRDQAWLEGDAAQVRFAFTVPARRFFVPLHFPGADDLDLIGLSPLWFTAGATREDGFDPRVRIASSAGEGEIPAGDEPWEQMLAALRLEQRQAGAGIATLAGLCRRSDLNPLVHALLLRNVAVCLLREGDATRARVLLLGAAEKFPACREFDYLLARACQRLGAQAEAVKWLRQATVAGTGVFCGSGGESSYRAHTLLAGMAEVAGRQRVAIHHYLTGVRQTPAFRPAVEGLLRQRLPAEMLASVQWELSRLARREPDILPQVFDFLLRHQAWAAAERLLEVLPLPAEPEQRLRGRLQALAPLYRPAPRRPEQPAGIVLQGPVLAHSSVARINRYLACGLADDARWQVALHPSACGCEPLAAFPDSQRLAGALHRLPDRLDLTVRHDWPPDFSPPPTGELAVILPWEFGAIPKAWLPGLRSCAEVWVPSQFVRSVFAQAGIDPRRVVVIPNGFDPRLYSPHGDAVRPAGTRGFTFLFVGGAIARKGMDLLLRAWRLAFSSRDEVSLVIKAIGGAGFYQHLGLGEAIAALAGDATAAPVILLEEEWSEARLPSLFRGCDALVLPYRGEGFGMPLLEALACGKPVVTTAAGPALEFCPSAATHWVAADPVLLPRPMWPPGEMTAPLTWFEPRLDELVDALRQAASHPASAAVRDSALAAAAGFTWERAVARYRERIASLTHAGLPARTV